MNPTAQADGRSAAGLSAQVSSPAALWAFHIPATTNSACKVRGISVDRRAVEESLQLPYGMAVVTQGGKMARRLIAATHGAIQSFQYNGLMKPGFREGTNDEFARRVLCVAE